MNEIGDLASGIITTEFSHITGSSFTIELSRVSGWLQNNIGTLNTLIYTSFSGENPGFDDEEDAIFSQLYLVGYYRKKIQDVLRGIDEAAISFLTLKEGDTTIQQVNKNEVAKTYRGIYSDTKNLLDELVDRYTRYEAYPRQVITNGGTGCLC